MAPIKLNTADQAWVRKMNRSIILAVFRTQKTLFESTTCCADWIKSKHRFKDYPRIDSRKFNSRNGTESIGNRSPWANVGTKPQGWVRIGD